MNPVEREISDETVDLKEHDSSGGMPETKWIVWTLFAAILLPFSCLGGYFLWNYVAACNQAVEASSWPAVPAHIVSAGVRELSGKAHRYEPEIVYTYRVGGSEFSATRIVLPLFGSSGSKHIAEEVLQPFPAGSNTTAYHSPDDPGFSILQPGLTPSHYGVGLILLAWVVIPVVLLVLFHRHLQARDSRA